MKTLGLLWSYRGFILGTVRRDFQSRYRNSVLGAAWVVINPLVLIIVYTVIFSQLMRSRLPGTDAPAAYGIYLCSGLLTWGFFSEIINRGQSMFTENANVLKKIKFPRITLPVIVLFNALLNFSIVFLLFALYLALSGNWPGWVFLALFPVLLLQAVLALGLGVIFGVLNVFFRDVGHFSGILLQFWFWLTPIVYPVGILPEFARDLVAFNPMYPVVSAYQEIFVSGRLPVFGDLLFPLCLGFAVCLIGLHLFRRHAGDLVDEL